MKTALRIWEINLASDRGRQFAVANAVTLAVRAGYEVPVLPDFCQETEALIQIGTHMRLLFSQGNPEGRTVAGHYITPTAAAT